MNPNPTTVLWLGRLYFVLSVLLWPATTIISTAFAIKQKVPRPAARRAVLLPAPAAE
jgi:hypothetical protein